MGNIVTRLTPHTELNESNVSDIVIAEFKQVKKSESPPAPNQQTKPTGLFKNIFNDPRSPSTFIARTPIQLFRTNSGSKFNHQELNESLNESVEIDILSTEEMDSLNKNEDLVEARSSEANVVEKLDDPRSPSVEIVRTPIVVSEEPAKNVDDNLIKKIAEKLISTKLSSDDVQKKNPEALKKKSKVTEKNLIYEDDECENFERFSTPPKKVAEVKDSERTPLSCVANKNRNPVQPRALLTSTPKSKIPKSTRIHSASKIPRRIAAE